MPKNVTYFLKCSSCNYSTKYISKTVDLHSRMNNHITSCRLGGSMDKSCRTRNKNHFFTNTYVYEISQRGEFTIL